MELENPDQTKDLVTIIQDFKELMNLGGNELRTRYLTKLEHQYPDFEFELKNGDIDATLINYEGETIAEFPPSLVELRIEDCPNLTQETRDRIEEYMKA